MNKKIVIGIAIIIFGLLSFFAGTKVNNKPTVQDFPQMNGQMRGGAGGSMPRNSSFGGMNSGEIISKDETGVTIKLQDGGSKIILISQSTSINKSTAGSKEDLTIGEKVMVMGQSNSDGSINAQSVQIGFGSQIPNMRSQGQIPQ